MEINPEVKQKVLRYMCIKKKQQQQQQQIDVTSPRSSALTSPVVSVCVVSDAEHGE